MIFLFHFGIYKRSMATICRTLFDFRSQDLLYTDKLTMQVWLELFHVILKREKTKKTSFLQMLLLYLYLKTWLYSWCLDYIPDAMLQIFPVCSRLKPMHLRSCSFWHFSWICSLWLKTSGVQFTQYTCALAWTVYLATPKGKQEKFNVKVWQLSILLATLTLARITT